MRKEGYIDNRGNYVRPGPDYQRLLMVALMNALAMLLAERMVSGLQFGSLLSLLLAALLFTVLNLSVKPVLQLAALPLTILTFAAFNLVLNGFMPGMVLWLMRGCSVACFGSTILATLVISLTKLQIAISLVRL